MTKDNELKKLTGSTQANHRAPELPLEVPNPPITLSPKELEIWDRSIQLMVDMKIITAADFDLVHDYAVLRTMFDQMIRHIKEEGLMVDWVSERGKTARRVNPLLAESLKLLPFLDKMRREMGFSPETRDKRKVLEALETEDKLDKFLEDL